MTRNMANLNVLSIGDPGDLNGFEDAISGNEQYKQWEQTQPVVQDVTEDATPATYRRFIYQLDTYHGQSGAPILYNNKCIGVHYGALASAHNVGFGITS